MLKRQLMVARATFLSVTEAWTSRRRAGSSGPHAAVWWPLWVSYLQSLIGPPQAGHMVMLWQDAQGRSAMSLMSSGPVGSILPAVPGSDGRTEDGRQDEMSLGCRSGSCRRS